MRFMTLLSVCPFAVVLGCGKQVERQKPPDALAGSCPSRNDSDHRAQWTNVMLENYEICYAFSGFSPGRCSYCSTVRSGLASAVRYDGAQWATECDDESLQDQEGMTVESIFDLSCSAGSVSYDGTYGYPNSLGWDDGFESDSYKVTKFTPQ